MLKNKFKLDNYKLTTIANKILDIDENILKSSAHDALFDVQVLKRLVVKNLQIESLVEQAKTFEDIELKLETSARTKNNLQFLAPLQGVISKSMLIRLAEFNITYGNLVETFKTKGIDKTRSVLRGKLIDGKPSIIKRDSIIDKIIQNVESTVII